MTTNRGRAGQILGAGFSGGGMGGTIIMIIIIIIIVGVVFMNKDKIMEMFDSAKGEASAAYGNMSEFRRF